MSVQDRRVSIDGQPPGPAHGLDVDEGGNGLLVTPDPSPIPRRAGRPRLERSRPSGSARAASG